MSTYSMELQNMEKIAADCDRNISMHTSNLLYFLQEEETNIYLISLLTEAYSISSKLKIELNYIMEEARDIEEKDGKVIVPLEEKSGLGGRIVPCWRSLYSPSRWGFVSGMRSNTLLRMGGSCGRRSSLGLV